VILQAFQDSSSRFPVPSITARQFFCCLVGVFLISAVVHDWHLKIHSGSAALDSNAERESSLSQLCALSDLAQLPHADDEVLYGRCVNSKTGVTPETCHTDCNTHNAVENRQELKSRIFPDPFLLRSCTVLFELTTFLIPV
jgi:hypothetical protein